MDARHPKQKNERFVVEGFRAFPGPSSLSLPKGGPGRAILASLAEPVVSALTGDYP